MVASRFNSSVDVCCIQCGKINKILFNKEDMEKWRQGQGSIQNILNYLSASERELLLSQICGECFDKMFPPMEEENE